MTTTLGLWLGPSLAVVVGAAGVSWVGWFQPRLRRRVAVQRIAERLAREDSAGYDHLHDRYLEHYLGGRRWDEELDKANEQAKDGTYYDARGPVPGFLRRALHLL